jgi:hypothetical protein
MNKAYGGGIWTERVEFVATICGKAGKGLTANYLFRFMQNGFFKAERVTTKKFKERNAGLNGCGICAA